MTWLHPGFYSGFAQQPNFGEVKLKLAEKDADVFVDSAYAGTSAKLKTMWLQPGAYTWNSGPVTGHSRSVSMF